MSIIRSAHAIVFASMVLVAPGLVAAGSLPVAHPAKDTPRIASKDAAALPTPAGAADARAAAALASGRGPVLAVAETTQDGGTVDEGTLLHFQFKITNQGGADLEIKEVKPSCGCTVPHWDKLIQPGKNGIIEAEVHTEHFRGPIMKHLTVISNDAARPLLELSLTAKVTPLVQIDPGPTAVLTVEDKPATQEFTLQRTGGQPMQILQVTTTQPYVKTELTPLPGSGHYKLAVTATADAPLGQTFCQVTLRTDLPKSEYLTLALILDRGIVTIPSVVFWPQLSREMKAPAQAIVTLTRQKGAFHVTGATVDDTKVQTKLQTAQEGQMYQIALIYAGGWEPGLVKKTLTVTTDDPKQPEIKVPVQAMVQAEIPAGPAAPAQPVSGASPVPAAPVLASAGAPRVVNPAKAAALAAPQTTLVRPAPAGAIETQAAAVRPASGHGPVLAVAETTHDGGTVDEGTVLHYQFKVTNQGGADLEIKEVKPSCGCTVPHWDKLIQPGKSGVIEAEVHTEHLRGPIEKGLTVISNDAAQPQFDLTLTAKVTPLVQIDPGPSALLTLGDKPVTQEFTLERTGGQPMRILQVTAAQPFVRTELTPLPGSGRYKLAVTATADAPLGQTFCQVMVQTDLPKAQYQALTLILNRGIVTIPSTVFWPQLSREMKVPAQTFVTLMRQKGAFHVTGATVDDPKLQTKLQPLQEGQQYQIALTYAGGWEPGQVKKTLTVTTDDPKQPEIKVPIQAIVQAEGPASPGEPTHPVSGAAPGPAAPVLAGAAVPGVVNQAKDAALTAPRIARLLPASAGAIEAPAAAVSPASGHGPVLAVAETTQDGGTVEEGTVLHYQFKVANRGGADLEITAVKPSCGCTVPHWDKLILPGKNGVIEAEVHSERFRGPFLKHLTVISNDAAHPELELSLTGKVTPLVQIDPGPSAGLSVEDRPVTQVFTLQRPGGQPMKILQVMPTPSYLKTELTPLPGSGRYKLSVTATMDTPLGRTPTSVIVRTDLPKAENLPLLVILDRGIVAVPFMVFLHVPPGEIREAVQGMVTISRQQGSFHVTGATVDDPKVQVKVETVREGQEYHVILVYAGGWEPGLVRKTLSVTTDDPKQPLIKVAVQATVPQALAGGPGGPAHSATGASPTPAAPVLASAAAPRVVDPAKDAALTAARRARALPASAVAIGAQTAAVRPASGHGPVLAVSETTQDGGTVDEGTVLHYQFKIANRGRADLEILQVRPSCGCTVPHWDKLIQPGKDGVIEAEVHTEHFRGPIQKRLTVISNDPAQPQLDLTLTAKIIPLMQIDPGPTALLTLEDKPVTQEFTLERNGGQPMKILQVIANEPYLRTELTPLPGSGRYKLAVTATMDTPLGQTSARVTVWTDLPKVGGLTLVMILQRGIVTSPPAVFLGPLAREPTAPVQSIVTLMRQKGSFHVMGATVGDPKLQAKLQTVQEGQQYQVVISYAGGWEAGLLQKMLVVTTDDPKQREIKVPVQALVQSPPAAGTTVAAH